MSRTADDRREDGSGRVVAGEPGLAHARAVVAHERRHLVVAHLHCCSRDSPRNDDLNTGTSVRLCTTLTHRRPGLYPPPPPPPPPPYQTPRLHAAARDIFRDPRPHACSARRNLILFRNSQLSTLYSTVKSRTEMTIITAVRYHGNQLTALA